MKVRSVASGVALVLALTAACANDWDLKAETEARAMIGKESSARAFDERIVPNELSCTHQGGGMLVVNNKFSDVWGSSVARCQNRLVLLLEQKVGRSERGLKWRIVDALLLPRDVTQTDPDPNRLRLTHGTVGDCEWEGHMDRSFYAALRYGDRTEVDWRSGVEHAWIFDLDRGRIVPVSPEGISCERIEP